MKITICDNNPDVILSMQNAFCYEQNVTCMTVDILSMARGTLFSPANSFGFMDGGVDHDYIRFFGDHLQAKVLDCFARRPRGYLPVGAADMVETGNEKIPRIIFAPTMSEPMAIVPYNIFRSFRAALKKFQELGLNGEVFTPGFGTGVGQVSPDDAADMMVKAYRSIIYMKDESEKGY